MNRLLSQRIYNPVLNDVVGNIPEGGSGTDILQIFMSNIMTIVFGLGIVVLVAMILIGSYEYITAGGDKDALQRSTKRMTQAVIGLLILLSVYLIARVIGMLFGFNVLQVNIPQLT